MRIIIKKNDIIFIDIKTRMGEVKTSEWTSSKGKLETESDKVKGNLLCLPS